MESTQISNRNPIPIVAIRGGVKRFGGIHALESIDIDIYDKEVLALLGDNGAGKSTLIKCISGVYPLDSGEILFKGRQVEIKKPDDALKLGIKTVYQELALFGVLNVTANLFAGAEHARWGFLKKKKMEKEAWKVFAKLKIKINSLKQKVDSLSGGQQHSIAIGRGVYIGQEPKLIIMDEPTAGLGVKQSGEVLRILKELRRNFGVVFITHNIDYAFEVADRIAVLYSGRLIGKLGITEANRSQIISLMMGIENEA